MRIRKRFLSFLSQQEEMEVSSFLAPAEGTAREAPEKVLNGWQSIKAVSHRLLGCSSYPFNSHVRDEHSCTNPVGNGEAVGEIQLTKERNKKRLLEEEYPSQTMVIEQGGETAGKKIIDLFSNSQMKENCSGTVTLNTKPMPVSSSFHKGDTKGIFKGNSKDVKAETAMRIGGSTAGRKERADGLSSSIEAGLSRRAQADGSCGLKYKGKIEDEDEDENEDKEHCSAGSSFKTKAKTRSLTSIYDDMRSQMPSSSKLNEI